MSTTTAENAVATKQVRPIDTVRAALEKMTGQFAMALPKHITPDRMLRVAMTAIQNTPKLLDCDRQSLYSAIMRAAQLGLEPDGILGQAYLIPYGKTVQFIPGYKGLIDLARRSGEVSNIIAKEVCANDDFKIAWHEEVPFKHEQAKSGDRGEVIGFWALARFKDGGFHWDYMTKQEVEAIRDKGNGKNNAVWKDYFIEMGKKTAIRRIAKYLPMSVQKAAAYEDLADAGKKFTDNEFGEIIIEGESAEVSGDDTAKGKGKKATKLDEFAAPDHNPETGEIIDQTATDDDVPANLRNQPRAVTVKITDGKNDWESFAMDWHKLIEAMADARSLEKARTLNQKNLDVLNRENPPKHDWCIEQLSARMVAVGGLKNEAA